MQTITARMISAPQAVKFIKLIAGKEAFCMCVRILFYI